ncbi:MAG: exodeoxyribonuclease VII large subunit [Bacilli bacterium]|nr:exodeoxyribonuclease VII large subunit [Bacilli bacterium]
MLPTRTVYTVSDINRYIKTLITNDENLKFIYVKGEISNFKPGANGHLYFSLKDKDCLINVAMFNNYAKNIAFVPKNGDEVVILASADVYPARGTYQLLAFEMSQVGLGDILVELEKLKKQLQSEGLFEQSRKRPINIYPKAIGVITAKNSAAIKDILTNVKRRYPITDIYVFYSAVQGESAPKELLRAFEESQKYNLDTLIIGRGGGASEDLSAFNDEKLVRAIASSKMPVIAAVGHEIDSTLVDFVADKRASTPTGAAELAVVDRREIEQKFQYALDDMKTAIKDKLVDMKDSVSSLKEELDEEMLEYIKDKQRNLKNLKDRLEALSPLSVLDRGFSITEKENGELIKDVKDLQKDDKVITILKTGTIYSKVEKVEGNKK